MKLSSAQVRHILRATKQAARGVMGGLEIANDAGGHSFVQMHHGLGGAFRAGHAAVKPLRKAQGVAKAIGYGRIARGVAGTAAGGTLGGVETRQHMEHEGRDPHSTVGHVATAIAAFGGSVLGAGLGLRSPGIARGVQKLTTNAVQHKPLAISRAAATFGASAGLGTMAYQRGRKRGYSKTTAAAQGVVTGVTALPFALFGTEAARPFASRAAQSAGFAGWKAGRRASSRAKGGASAVRDFASRLKRTMTPMGRRSPLGLLATPSWTGPRVR